MNELRWAIVAASIVALFSWWRAGRKNARFVLSRWAVMLIPAGRLVFYVVRCAGICTTTTLNEISSGLILWTMILLAIWGFAIADE